MIRTLAILLATAGTANAYCASGNPMDIRCNPSDFLQSTWNNPSWYARNPAAANATIQSCLHPPAWPVRPTPAAWCAAAYRATYGRYGR